MPPGTDWEQLTSEGLWTAWSPLLVHIVARGLLTILRGLINLLTYFIHRCLPVKLRHVLVVLLALMWLPTSIMCGAVGLCCAVAAYTLTVRSALTALFPLIPEAPPPPTPNCLRQEMTRLSVFKAC